VTLLPTGASTIVLSGKSKSCKIAISFHKHKIIFYKHITMKTSTFIKQVTMLTGASLLSGSSLLEAGCASHNKSQKAPNIIIFFTDDRVIPIWASMGLTRMCVPPTWTSWPEMGYCLPMVTLLHPNVCPHAQGIITGRHQNAFGLEDNNLGPLSHDEYTIAERLRDVGYVTGMVGKWHLDLVQRGAVPGKVFCRLYATYPWL
jgi:hypothetical protein